MIFFKCQICGKSLIKADHYYNIFIIGCEHHPANEVVMNECSEVSVPSTAHTQPATSEDFLSFSRLCCRLTQDQGDQGNPVIAQRPKERKRLESRKQVLASQQLVPLKRKTIAEEFREWTKQFV